MNTEFDELLETYLETNVGIANQFLPVELTKQLQLSLLSNFAELKFQDAKIGDRHNEIEHKAIRSDKIYWLDRSHNKVEENSFLNKMDDFIAYLNATCYTGIRSCEFHYAMYEPGNFYGKHKDAFQQNSNRAFSMIHYLNPDWKQNDGGELCIYQNSNTQQITPTAGKSVFFKSTDLIHEVLPTTQQRLSITGWLKTG